jgi:ADP-ribose pyrophosphatase YjhB (NUDIX family)
MAPPDSTPFHHCYHCGSAALEQRSWRQQQCLSCGYQLFLTPTPAAVTLVLDAAGQLLLMRRAHEPGLGKLGLPGGIIEPWESAELAATRELQEETGIHVPATAWSYLGSYCNSYPFQGYTWPTLDLALVARVQSFTGMCAVDGEALEILPVPLHEVDAEALAFATHTQMVKDLRAAR